MRITCSPLQHCPRCTGGPAPGCIACIVGRNGGGAPLWYRVPRCCVKLEFFVFAFRAALINHSQLSILLQAKVCLSTRSSRPPIPTPTPTPIPTLAYANYLPEVPARILVFSAAFSDPDPAMASVRLAAKLASAAGVHVTIFGVGSGAAEVRAC
jgi:hypothetical protein